MNPIRAIRVTQGDSLHTFAKKLGVNYQTLYLNEAGCYPTILPQIMQELVDMGHSELALKKAYSQFIKTRRHEFKHKNEPYNLPPVGDLYLVAPIIRWRQSIDYTRSSLCKALCLQPAQISRLELNKTFQFPQQLLQAFKDIDFPDELRTELQYRTEEFYSRTHSPYFSIAGDRGESL